MGEDQAGWLHSRRCWLSLHGRRACLQLDEQRGCGQAVLVHLLCCKESSQQRLVCLQVRQVPFSVEDSAKPPCNPVIKEDGADGTGEHLL